jgi:guanylate kinase
MTTLARRGLCLVLAAPSGGGKGAVTDALLAAEPELSRSVSVTTRAPRAGEVEGVHYYFLTENAFAAAEAAGALLEWARVLGGKHAYGTPHGPVERTLAQGRDLVFDIDWQGYRAMRGKLPADVVGIFLLPPDMATLERRLRARGTDAEPEIIRRMDEAPSEIAHWREFDYVVVNDHLPDTIAQVRVILHAERSRRARLVGLEDFARGLLAGTAANPLHKLEP